MSGWWIDTLKKRGRVLKKRGRLLKKRRLVRGTGGGPLLHKGGGGWLFKKGGGGVLKKPWRPLRSSTPSRRPSLCLPTEQGAGSGPQTFFNFSAHNEAGHFWDEGT